MNAPDSSARLLQNKSFAPFQASLKSANNIQQLNESQASLKNADHSNPTKDKANSQASLNSGQTATVKATKGKGQKSKRLKAAGLTFRVRLSDRGYRVMLLTVEEGRERELYLASLLSEEWSEVEHNSAAFLEKVIAKLRVRIAKADDKKRTELRDLLSKIGGQENEK